MRSFFNKFEQEFKLTECSVDEPNKPVKENCVTGLSHLLLIIIEMLWKQGGLTRPPNEGDVMC